MGSRKMHLTHWYPHDRHSCETMFSDWSERHDSARTDAIPAGVRLDCAIVPHAGWVYSGETAYGAFRALSERSAPKHVFLFGGHMSQGGEGIILDYEAYETPFGPITVDVAAAARLSSKFKLAREPDWFDDNTVEINFPFIKRFFPGVPCIALYCPYDAGYEHICRDIFDTYPDSIVVGSADLTHYGPNFGFTPHGTGDKAYKWVKDNEEKLVNALCALDDETAFRNIETLKTSCSLNSIAAVLHYAKLLGKTKGWRTGRFSSYEMQKSSSFVGYAGVVL